MFFPMRGEVSMNLSTSKLHYLHLFLYILVVSFVLPCAWCLS